MNRRTAPFTLQLEPIRSDGGDLAVPLDFHTITLEFALCVFPQVPDTLALYMLVQMMTHASKDIKIPGATSYNVIEILSFN